MLKKYPYTARQVYQRIKEDGFDGRITTVEDYIKKIHPPRIKAYLKLEFALGEYARWTGDHMGRFMWVPPLTE